MHFIVFIFYIITRTLHFYSIKHKMHCADLEALSSHFVFIEQNLERNKGLFFSSLLPYEACAFLQVMMANSLLPSPRAFHG